MKRLSLSILAIAFIFSSCNSDKVEEIPKEPEQPEVEEVLATDPNYKALDEFYEEKKSKLASDPYNERTEVQGEMKGWLNNWRENINKTAKSGSAGKLGKGDSEIVVNEKGFEYQELVRKGLIGAYQLSNVMPYSYAATQEGADKRVILEGVSNYLLGSANAYNKAFDENTNELTKCLSEVSKNESFSKVKDDVINTLKELSGEGITPERFAEDIYKVFNTSEKVVAIKAVESLLKGAEELNGSSLSASTAHKISEGLGFVYALRFTYNPSGHRPFLSKQQVDNFFSTLDLWEGDKAKIKIRIMADKIASLFRFSVEQVQ